MQRIVIFGLPYSPNTGDGVIAECLSTGLRAAHPGVTVSCIDISGRTEFGAVTVRNRSLVLAILKALPRPLAQSLVSYKLGRMLDQFEPAWKDALRGADLAVIGGGQILSDADLNFCLKLARVARLLQEEGCPAVIHAAGVARNWSPRGQALFRALLDCDLRAVGLRDGPSIAAWQDQIGGGGPRPHPTRDPALIAAEVYGVPPQGNGRIGLCVTDPHILTYHAEGRKSAVSGKDVFADIALALVASGYRVTLFCNGAAEDRSALVAIQTKPAIASAMAQGQIAVEEPPSTPTELATIIGQLSAVVAHRLHACILGYAFQRPIVGLGWDRKLESFFQSVGLDNAFLPASDLSPQNVVQRLEAAQAAGIDPARHAAVLAETRVAINGIFDGCKPARFRQPVVALAT